LLWLRGEITRKRVIGEVRNVIEKQSHQTKKIPVAMMENEKKTTEERKIREPYNKDGYDVHPPVHSMPPNYYPPQPPYYPPQPTYYPPPSPLHPLLRPIPKKCSKAPWIVVLLLLGVIFYLSGYIVSEEDNSELERIAMENDKLRAENANLTKNNSSLSWENFLLNLENGVVKLQKEEFEYWLSVRGGFEPEKHGHLFLTPEDENVETKMKEVLGDDADGDLSWDDMRTIDRWVYDNIEYNHDTPLAYPNWTGEEAHEECWLFPAETLEYERGDCEDHAFLALSMFYAEEKVGWAYAASVTFEDESRHMAIFLNVEGDKLSILDPTASWDNHYSDTESDKLEEYGNHYGKDVSKVDYIFNQNTYKEFDTLQEFYDDF